MGSFHNVSVDSLLFANEFSADSLQAYYYCPFVAQTIACTFYIESVLSPYDCKNYSIVCLSTVVFLWDLDWLGISLQHVVVMSFLLTPPNFRRLLIEFQTMD